MNFNKCNHHHKQDDINPGVHSYSFQLIPCYSDFSYLSCKKCMAEPETQPKKSFVGKVWEMLAGRGQWDSLPWAIRIRRPRIWWQGEGQAAGCWVVDIHPDFELYQDNGKSLNQNSAGRSNFRIRNFSPSLLNSQNVPRRFFSFLGRRLCRLSGQFWVSAIQQAGVARGSWLLFRRPPKVLDQPREWVPRARQGSWRLLKAIAPAIDTCSFGVHFVENTFPR